MFNTRAIANDRAGKNPETGRSPEHYSLSNTPYHGSPEALVSELQ